MRGRAAPEDVGASQPPRSGHWHPRPGTNPIAHTASPTYFMPPVPVPRTGDTAPGPGWSWHPSGSGLGSLVALQTPGIPLHPRAELAPTGPPLAGSSW